MERYRDLYYVLDSSETYAEFTHEEAVVILCGTPDLADTDTTKKSKYLHIEDNITNFKEALFRLRTTIDMLEREHYVDWYCHELYESYTRFELKLEWLINDFENDMLRVLYWEEDYW